MSNAAGIADGALGDLEALERALLRRIRALLLRLNTVPGGSELERLQARNAADVLREVQTALEREGRAAAEGVMGRRAREAVDSLVPEGLRVPVDAEREIAQLLVGRQREIADALGATSQEMRRLVQAAVSGGSAVDELLEVAEARVGASVARIRTTVDTAVMGSARVGALEAAQEAAGDVDLVYVYEGPLDRITRPFCRPLVGKAVTETGLAQLDNGQGLSVAAFGGGYNCRHIWVPITLEEARRRGLALVG